MTQPSPTPRGSGPAAPQGELAKVVFVSYGPFDCNSAGHIAGFAAELSRHGLAVAVCARDSVQAAYAFGPPPFEFFTLKDLGEDPRGVIGFDGALDPGATAMVCWTPRKASRRPLQKAVRALKVPYVVHLEDNEDHLSALRFADDQAAAAQDAADRAELIAEAGGVTFIEQRLAETLPAGKPSLLLEPGVDLEGLAAPLPPLRRASLLRAAGVPPGACVLVYPGNIHRANAGEMAELYRAVRRLREAGRNLVLVKTGKDDIDLSQTLGFDPAEAGVIALGQVERPFLLELVKCADLFVQPGAPGPFNDYRLPSKLPEFMAIGRPLVLPATNLGLRLRDREQALLLRTGSAEEIAGGVGEVLDDAALASRLASEAQAFARGAFRWDRQGLKLLEFLRGLPR
jgi:glycosyltransferase involved in cell wall biosynthesis